jgi:hypothetical protein
VISVCDGMASIPGLGLVDAIFGCRLTGQSRMAPWHQDSQNAKVCAMPLRLGPLVGGSIMAVGLAAAAGGAMEVSGGRRLGPRCCPYGRFSVRLWHVAPANRDDPETISHTHADLPTSTRICGSILVSTVIPICSSSMPCLGDGLADIKRYKAHLSECTRTAVCSRRRGSLHVVAPQSALETLCEANHAGRSRPG